ncbi:FAD-dependent oxidoreductase [Winogradskyella sp. 3972H.M.0a.05]|uniref:NAD(P)/FAD-dependent oxidoreductase n=1 Tax=Winogradskyella sp. 3972H.M.0a.05 TaxID=2950277 RepID=UPI003397B991
MSKSVVIIGGGIIGLCTAYYLHKERHQVTIVDKSNGSEGASYVNAGYITPSHIVPLASPGIITQGLKWMLNPASPFYIKPRLNGDFLKWALAFKRSATKQNVEQSIGPIKDINVFSRELYSDMKSSGDFDFHYERKGLLLAYKDDKVGEEEWDVGQKAIDLGLKVEHLSQKDLAELEPKANLDVKGAVYFHSDAHMTPEIFMKDMKRYLKSVGVSIQNEEVIDIEISGDAISRIITKTGSMQADEFVLAAGSWSGFLNKKLGLKLLLQAGKGYRINVERETNISIPTILCEAKVAVTPMQGYTRFAGTMEIGGINHNINPVRVNAIAKASEHYYKGLKITDAEKAAAQCGLRPLSPDGLPYIGRFNAYKNLTIATGHAMMGWSMGPATGKLVAEIISEQLPSLDLQPYHPDRKF